MTDKKQKLLEKLHTLIGQELVDRMKSGEATTADINAAVKFLHNNGVDLENYEDSALEELAKVLPFDPEEDGQDDIQIEA